MFLFGYLSQDVALLTFRSNVLKSELSLRLSYSGATV